ncbi:hypothetical protein ADUPG1_001154, partial [Aduncisulcus paluster]
LAEAKPDYAGISIRNVDNVDSFTSHTNKFIHKAKLIVNVVKETGIPVIAGGAGFSLLPEEILDFTGADYGVIGEGERKMVELIARLEQGKETKQIYGKEKGFPATKSRFRAGIRNCCAITSRKAELLMCRPSVVANTAAPTALILTLKGIKCGFVR